MLRSKIAIIAGCMMVCSTIAIGAPKTPQMSPLQIQQIETREFDAEMSNVYPAVISVLQDNGYTITTSDRAGGIVTAAAPAKSKLSYNIWYGVGKKKRAQNASFFMEPRPGGRTRVRMNITNGLSKSNLVYGGVRSDTDTPLLDAAVYQQIFEKISQAVFIRIAADAPSSQIPVSGGGHPALPPSSTATTTDVPTRTLPLIPVVASPQPAASEVRSGLATGSIPTVAVAPSRAEPVSAQAPAGPRLITCADGTSMYTSDAAATDKAKCGR